MSIDTFECVSADALFVFLLSSACLHTYIQLYQVIAWQEVFQTAKDPVGTLGKDAVISVWKGDWQDTMAAVTAAGMRAVLSNCW